MGDKISLYDVDRKGRQITAKSIEVDPDKKWITSSIQALQQLMDLKSAQEAQ